MSIMYPMSGGHIRMQSRGSCFCLERSGFFPPSEPIILHTAHSGWVLTTQADRVSWVQFSVAAGLFFTSYHLNHSAGVVVTIYTLFICIVCPGHIRTSTDCLMHRLAKLCTVILVSWQPLIVYYMIVISVCVCLLNSFYISTIIAGSA